MHGEKPKTEPRRKTALVPEGFRYRPYPVNKEESPKRLKQRSLWKGHSDLDGNQWLEVREKLESGRSVISGVNMAEMRIKEGEWFSKMAFHQSPASIRRVLGASRPRSLWKIFPVLFQTQGWWRGYSSDLSPEGLPPGSWFVLSGSSVSPWPCFPVLFLSMTKHTNKQCLSPDRCHM